MDDGLAFRIGDESVDDATILAVSGEIDIAAAPAFERYVLRAIGAGRGGLVLDLAQVTFLDSIALTALVHVLERLQASGERLVLVAQDERLVALIDVAGLADRFEICTERGDALMRVGAR